MVEPSIDFTISTVCEYDVAIQTVSAVMNLMSKYRFIWDLGGVSGCNRSKNSKWTKFLVEDKSPYLINIDRDMVFNTHDVDLMVEDLKSGYDLVGAAYTTHNGKVLTTWGKDGKGLEFNGTIYEVLFLGTGFLGISRRLLEKLVNELRLPLLNIDTELEQYPFCMDGVYGDNFAYGQIWLSEDYYFCDLCKKIGVSPMLDTRIHVGHMGSAIWYTEHAAMFQGNVAKINEVVK